MPEEKKIQCRKAVQNRMKEIRKEIEDIKDQVSDPKAELPEEVLDQRKALNRVLMDLNVLFEEFIGIRDAELETEYNLISDDDEKTFLLVYIHPENKTIDYFSSHQDRESALNTLRKMLEDNEGEAVQEEIKSGSGN